MHLHQYLSGVYQSPRLDALHLHTMYIRVGRMNEYKLDWYLAQQELHTPLWGSSDIQEAVQDSVSDFLLDREIHKRTQRMKLIAGGFAATKLAKSAIGISRTGSKIKSKPLLAATVRLGGKGVLRVVPYIGTALLINDTVNIAKFAWNYFD